MQIHLDDCSELWEEYINEASESILVFTPYFDWLLVELFKNCSLDFSEINLVTQLDRQDTSEENRNRLNRIAELINLGVNVHILNRLHAKVLIVDDEHAFFGSQNFTKYSTDSIEISTQIERYEGFDEVFDYFSELLAISRDVTVEELNWAAGFELFSTREDDEEDEDED